MIFLKRIRSASTTAPEQLSTQTYRVNLNSIFLIEYFFFISKKYEFQIYLLIWYIHAKMVHTYIHTYKHTYIHTYVCAYVRAWVHTYVHMLSVFIPRHIPRHTPLYIFYTYIILICLPIDIYFQTSLPI